MDTLRTELDQLEDLRLAYVMARSRVNSDRQGYMDAGIHKTTFYTWSTEERTHLNDLAQRFKRETAERALMALQDAVIEAAEVKVGGLHSRDERVKQGASSEILDRVLGKATNSFEVSGKNGEALKIIVEYANSQTDTTGVPSGAAGDQE